MEKYGDLTNLWRFHYGKVKNKNWKTIISQSRSKAKYLNGSRSGKILTLCFAPRFAPNPCILSFIIYATKFKIVQTSACGQEMTIVLSKSLSFKVIFCRMPGSVSCLKILRAIISTLRIPSVEAAGNTNMFLTRFQRQLLKKTNQTTYFQKMSSQDEDNICAVYSPDPVSIIIAQGFYFLWE